MARRAVFPFTAIVGQDRMKRALILQNGILTPDYEYMSEFLK